MEIRNITVPGKLLYYNLWFFIALGALLAAGCAKTPLTSQQMEKNTPGSGAVAIDMNRMTALADSLANSYVTKGEVPGLSIAISKKGEVVFSKAYGKADVEAGTSVTTQTAFGITSISKQFAAATALKLVEQGKLSLDDPITKYIPDYPVQGRLVTVRNLLNHTSGTSAMRSSSSIADKQWFSRDIPFAEMVKLFGTQPFEFEPGQKHDYNNFGYLLLGEIMGRVTGMPWHHYLQKEMLRPLGLAHTQGGDAKRPAPNSSKTYLVKNQKPEVAPFVSMYVLGASGDLFSTAEDLVKWSYQLHKGKIVSSASLQQMTAPTQLPNGETAQYGFGVNIGEVNGQRKYFHGGTSPWGSYLAYYPVQEISIAVLTNMAGAGREKGEAIEKELARVALGIKEVNLPLSPAEMTKYEGTYTLSLGARTMDLRVFAQDGVLKAQATGQGVGRLLYTGNHTFNHSEDAGIRVAFQIANGQAESLILYQKGREMLAKRKI